MTDETREQQKKTRRFTWLIYLFAIVIAISLVGGGVGIYDRFQQSNARRDTQTYLNHQFKIHDERQTQAWHIVFCDAERQIKKSKTVTPQERTDAINFYDRELQRLGAKPCAGGK